MQIVLKKCSLWESLIAQMEVSRDKDIDNLEKLESDFEEYALRMKMLRKP